MALWIMEYLVNLTVISALLSIGLLKVVHFNDLYLWYKLHRALNRYRSLYRYMDGILWDVITLGSYISKTIHPIFMKLTGLN